MNEDGGGPTHKGRDGYEDDEKRARHGVGAGETLVAEMAR